MQNVSQWTYLNTYTNKWRKYSYLSVKIDLFIHHFAIVTDWSWGNTHIHWHLFPMNPGNKYVAVVSVSTLLMSMFWTELWSALVVPFIRHHHLMRQHDNTQPHVVRPSTQFLEAEKIPVLLVSHWECLGCSGSNCMTGTGCSYMLSIAHHTVCRFVYRTREL